MNEIFNIIDSHCHLDFPDFNGEVTEIVSRANKARVTKMVSICTKLCQEPNVRKIAEQHDPVFYAAGTHPMNAASEPMVSVNDLIQIAEHPKMVGIGETGLDYHYTEESKQEQKQSLIIHIEAARQANLPLIIHSRAADADMADILSSEHKNAPFTCVMHCFSSSPKLGHTALDLDFYLSMSGVATFKNSTDLRDFFKTVPLDRILVETDAPYLAPPPFRGKRNEPAYTRYTAEVGAELFNIPLADFSNATTDNFYRLFTKVPK